MRIFWFKSFKSFLVTRLSCFLFGIAIFFASQFAIGNSNTSCDQVQSGNGLRIYADPSKESTGQLQERKKQESFLIDIRNFVLRYYPAVKLPPLLIFLGGPYPFTYYEKSPCGEVRVRLSVKGEAWVGFVYEFAHELTHILSNYNLVTLDKRGQAITRNRWFEEALCEVASLFILKQYAEEIMAGSPSDSQVQFANALLDFRKKLLFEPHRWFNVHQLPTWFRTNEKELADGPQSAEVLKKNPVDRNLTEIVANHLQVYFEDDPTQWASLTYLNLYNSQAFTFKDYLVTWYKSVPHAHQGFVNEIIGLFGYDKLENVPTDKK